MDAVLDLAILVTLWATGLGLGTGLPAGAVGGAVRRVGLFTRVIVLDVVLIPLAVAWLSAAIAVPSGFATGLIIVGAASAGPLGIKAAQLARADTALAVALVVVLELANIVVVPFWTAMLLPDGVTLPLVDIVRTLVIGILLPVFAGFAIRWARSGLAARLVRPASTVSSIGLLVIMALVIVRDGPAVVRVLGSGVLVVALATIGFALVGGWLNGGPERGSRAAAALVTSVRANAPALAVAGAVFGAEADATLAIVVFGLFSITIPPVAAIGLGRLSSGPAEATAPSQAT